MGLHNIWPDRGLVRPVRAASCFKVRTRRARLKGKRGRVICVC